MSSGDGGKTQPWEMMREASTGGWNPYQKGPQNWTGWAAMDYMHPVETSPTMGQWGIMNAPLQQQTDICNWTGPQNYGDQNQWHQDMWKNKAADVWWHQHEDQARGMGAKGYKNMMDGKERQNSSQNNMYPMQGTGKEYYEQWKARPDGSEVQRQTNLMGTTMWIPDPNEENMRRQKGGKWIPEEAMYQGGDRMEENTRALQKGLGKNMGKS